MMRDEIFLDWRHRWSMLCRHRGRWTVITAYVDPVGDRYDVHHPHWLPADSSPVLRVVRWWSPRDLVRFPLHWWWARSHW